jgi:hypothetical protein
MRLRWRNSPNDRMISLPLLLTTSSFSYRKVPTRLVYSAFNTALHGHHASQPPTSYWKDGMLDVTWLSTSVERWRWIYIKSVCTWRVMLRQVMQGFGGTAHTSHRANLGVAGTVARTHVQGHECTCLTPRHGARGERRAQTGAELSMWTIRRWKPSAPCLPPQGASRGLPYLHDAEDTALRCSKTSRE